MITKEQEQYKKIFGLIKRYIAMYKKVFPQMSDNVVMQKVIDLIDETLVEK